MSRRKQLHPKPLKRKADDDLDELADLLHLPTDVLTIKEAPDSSLEYSVFTHLPLREGALFGPYSGFVVRETDPSGKGTIVESKEADGKPVLLLLGDEAGGWLKLVKTACSPEVANLSISVEGAEVWATVARDTDTDTELTALCRIHTSSSPHLVPGPYSSLRPAKVPVLVDGSRENLVACPEMETFGEDPASEKDARRLSPGVVPDHVADTNGTFGSPVKQEPSSPTPSFSPVSPGTAPDMCHGDLFRSGPYTTTTGLNGCKLPVFPFGLPAGMPSGDGFKCAPCGITFSSQRTLQAHQWFYCSHRPNIGVKAETTDGNSNGVSKADTSPPPEYGDPEKDETPGSDMRISRPCVQDSRSVRQGRVYSCQFCMYTADKKASLTRHMRMHGSPPPSADSPATASDLPLNTPPMARYCANCDIQFSSYKNYQVHKQFYCNTRHVQKSTPAGSPPQAPSANVLSPDKTIQGPSPYNMVFNQPLYAAISTSPLILVPCSYIAGGGLSPAAGLVPAGNIIIPRASAGASSDGSTSPAPSVIPAFTVLPGTAPAFPPIDSKPTLDPVARDEDQKEPPSSAKDAPSVHKDTDTDALQVSSPSAAGSVKSETGDTPLDLTVRKRDVLVTSPQPLAEYLRHAEEEENATTSSSNIALVSMDTVTSSSSSSSTVSPGPKTAVPLSVISPALMADSSSVPPPPQVLVKQGTSKCKECNIVFYKYENYIAHKKHYCSARRHRLRRKSSSPENKGSAEEECLDKDDCSRQGMSPVTTSPKTLSSRTPPTQGESTDGRSISPPPTQPVYQFFCVACGIKFTSLDNLHAHQTYYCPKREALRGQQVCVTPLPRTQEFRCSKCKNAYPSEDSLKNHPCVVQRKCPYCDVYCPTLSAAQRHLVTHTGVKAFRCSICGYKGHTLRGMRTHIRIHLEKGNTTPEEAFIVCVDEEGAAIGCSTGRKSMRDRTPSERTSSVSSNESIPCDINLGALTAASGALPHLRGDVSSKKTPPTTSDDHVLTTDIVHWCQYCGYSSSYKGNVVRHVKLVHRDLVASPNVGSAVQSRTGHPPEGVSSHSKPETMDITNTDKNCTTDSAVSVICDAKLSQEMIPNGFTTGTTPTSGDLPSLKAEASPPLASAVGNKSPAGVSSGQSSLLQPPKTRPKYCKSCDITFNQLKNFIAHKKYYCTPRSGDGANQESAAVQ